MLILTDKKKSHRYITWNVPSRRCLQPRSDWRLTIMISNKNVRHAGNRLVVRDEEISSAELIRLTQLLGLSVDCIYRWIVSLRLRAQLRSLERQADYFAWQQENGTAGLAETHKHIAMLRSDLHRLG
jgi:hypothetical protein